MTQKQAHQFNTMLEALHAIGQDYATPKQLRKSADQHYGLDYEEALEMAYENIQAHAKRSYRGIRPIDLTKLK